MIRKMCSNFNCLKYLSSYEVILNKRLGMRLKPYCKECLYGLKLIKDNEYDLERVALDKKGYKSWSEWGDYRKKLVADEDYYQSEEKFKSVKADVMMSEQVTGLGSRELREAQADLVISTMPEYQDYLEKKFKSKLEYEKQCLITDLLSIAKTLSAGGILDEDAKVLLEGVEDDKSETKN